MLVLCISTITVVITVSFFIVYLNIYINITNEREERLDQIEIHFNSPASFLSDINFSNSFIMLSSYDGYLTYLYSYIDVSEEVFNEVWERKNSRGTIKIENRLWLYRISQNENNFGRLGALFLVLNRTGDYIISFTDISESNEFLRNILITLILVLILSTTAIFFLSLYISNRFIKPVEESLKKQKQFISDASHELKTPLSIIASNMEVLLHNGEDTINNQEKWISYIKNEITNMGKLISDMLYLAKIEAKSTNKIINFSDIIEYTVASIEAMLFEKNISLVSNISPNINIYGDEEKLTTLLRILLDNALKYTNNNGEIWLDLNKIKNNIVLTVKNTGKGISKEDLPHIFERFYRGEEKIEGTGLGLAIAKEIINSIDATILASSNNNITEFQIKF